MHYGKNHETKYHTHSLSIMRAIYLMLEAWSIVFKIKLQPKKEMDMIKKINN